MIDLLFTISIVISCFFYTTWISSFVSGPESRTRRPLQISTTAVCVTNCFPKCMEEQLN
jgi:hypothetical protein